jgi:imidazoleglycerol phosphate dehydratase HisB
MRKATVARKTAETDISVSVELDGTGRTSIETGIGFLDHMLGALAKHSRIDTTLTCKGDLEVDDHHSAEDCALVLGSAIDEALGARAGIRRFGWAYAPLDEALARAVVDLSGRPHAEVDMGLSREDIGGMNMENVPHVIRSLATTLRATIHVDVLRGENDHHRAEAGYKALALALRQAVEPDGRAGGVPSTKGVL